MTTHTASWDGKVLAGGRYQVLAPLGEGGMALVYKAHDRNLDTDVVLKVPRQSLLLEDPEYGQRFTREVRALVRLNHPHVCKVIDVGSHDGVPFAVLQCLAGGALLDRLGTHPGGKPVPGTPEDLPSWLPAIAEALDFIHAQRYVHRDVKPANILFDEHGNAYLSDFGIVKALGKEAAKRTANLTLSGTVLGTPEYMAPELIMGQEYDGRVDQYALAVTVFEVLSGRGLFEAPTPAAILVKQTTEAPPALHTLVPSLPRAISVAVEKALAKEPGQRYPSCAAFARAALAAAAARAAAGQELAPVGEESLKAACPSCGKFFRLPPGVATKNVRCPACHAVLSLKAKGAPRDAGVIPLVPEREAAPATAAETLTPGSTKSMGRRRGQTAGTRRSTVGKPSSKRKSTAKLPAFLRPLVGPAMAWARGLTPAAGRRLIAGGMVGGALLIVVLGLRAGGVFWSKTPIPGLQSQPARTGQAPEISDDRIVGKWVSVGTPTPVTQKYSNDGWLTIAIAGTTTTGTYKLNGDEIEWRSGATTVKVKVKFISSTEMVLSNAAGQRVRYKK